jgi:hypothetical protein
MAKKVEKRQRAVQRQVKRAERQRPKDKPEAAMQAGARSYPSPPFRSSISVNLERRSLSTRVPCVTRPTTSDRESSKTGPLS